MFSRKKLENSKSWILLRQHKQSLGWPRWPPPPPRPRSRGLRLPTHNRCHLDYFQHFEKKTIHPPSSKKLESTWVLVLDDTLGKKYSGRFFNQKCAKLFYSPHERIREKKIVYIYLFGQQQAQSNCILYYKRPLELLYYFLWEILWKEESLPRIFPWNCYVYLLDFSCS